MEINDAIQTLQQFERLDDYQTSEIIRLIKAQSELIETQGLVLAARDKIIQMQADAINEQNRMIEKAINAMAAASRCVFSELQRCPDDSTEIGCPGCVRRWLEATP